MADTLSKFLDQAGTGYLWDKIKYRYDSKLDEITEAVKGAKVAYIQRSRGYSLRGAFTIADIEKMVKEYVSEEMK